MTGAAARFNNAFPRGSDIAALLAGTLVPLGLSPFGLWPVTIAAIAVLVCVTGDSAVSIRRGALRFYLFGLGMYGVGTSWIYVSIHEHGGAAPLLAAFLVGLFVLGISLFMLLAGWLFMRFVRPLPLGIVVGFPLVWFFREWAMTWVLTGFPWLFPGYGHLDTSLGGYVPVIGAMGVSLIVVLIAALLAWLVMAPSRRRMGIAMTGVAVLWAGGFALKQVEFVRPTGEPVTVSAVQGNIDQRVKWRRDMVGPIIDTYLGLTNTEWGQDIVVWPEASLTLFREGGASLLKVLDRRAGSAGTTLILGIPDRGDEGEFQNTAIAIGEGAGQYVKRRLVPFGEYVPLEGLLRGMIDFFDLPMSRNRPGPWEQAPLTASGLNVSMSICYEIVYPELVRTLPVRPDLLVTISNDTWFGDSIGPWQHMEMARARALENGRYLVRATNNGITAIVDPNGQIIARLARFEPGVLRGEVRRVDGVTPWARVGITPLALIAAAALLAMAGFGRFRRGATVSDEPIG